MTPDGKSLILGRDDGNVVVMNDDGTSERQRFHVFGQSSVDNRKKRLGVSGDARILTTADELGAIHLWQRASASNIPVPFGASAFYSRIAIRADGRNVAAVNRYSSCTEIWSVRDQKLLHSLEMNAGGRISPGGLVHFPPVFVANGNQLVTAYDAEQVAVWDVQSGKQTRLIKAVPKGNSPSRDLR